MRCSPRVLLVLLAGCATSSGLPLLTGGTGGGGAGGGIGVGGFGGNSGVGGFGLGGAGGTAPSSVDAAACAPFGETFMPACIACLDVSCCDVAAMCFAVPDCFGYASCQQNCPPAATDGGTDGGGSTNVCLQACAQSFPMAGAAFTALSACLAASCPSCPY